MVIYNEKKNCCGCTACMNVCPVNAITMIPDKEGFLYPYINQEKCNNCGLCRKVCSFNDGYKHDSETPINVYAVKHKSEEERVTSRSGGMFVALSDEILNNRGIVYGAEMDKNLYVLHKRVSTREDIHSLKGSKYVQSDMTDMFNQVKSDLIDQREVLFSGTPCQISGLRSFLGENFNTEKLILCDIVCHGTPSPLIYEEYIKYFEKKHKHEIIKFDFRDKTFGWDKHFESMWLDNGQKITQRYYTDLFYQHIIFRPACANCKFANLRRPSDITLADFWGIDKAVPGFNDNKGISLVFINSDKGKQIFELIKDKVHYIESKIEDCMQPNLRSPSTPATNRIDFWDDYQIKGFNYIMEHYTNYKLTTKYTRKTKSLFNKIFRKLKFIKKYKPL